MKVQNWFDVECDECGKHLCDFQSDMQRSKKLAINQAKVIGWKYNNKEDKNYCPECLNRNE